MKILIAPDKFKGSLTAMQVCKAIGSGLQKANPTIETVFHPMADGGDGSLEVLADFLTLHEESVETLDPLGRSIHTRYFTSEGTAFVELALASGLALLSPGERNPLLTSTLGTGMIIRDAIRKGCDHIYLFIGGSSTNDAGMGIASVLGVHFLDKENNILEPVGSSLPHVRFIKKQAEHDFSNIKLSLLCDVDNPLFGPNGAAYVYALQKGATELQVKFLDEGLKHFADIILNETGKDISLLPGVGAAGGIGASLTALLNAELKSGFRSISEITGLESRIAAADMVISGEGKLDSQSIQGKVTGELAMLCKKYNKPLTLFVGKNELSSEASANSDLNKILEITQIAKGPRDAMSHGAKYLEELAFRFASENIVPFF